MEISGLRNDLTVSFQAGSFCSLERVAEEEDAKEVRVGLDVIALVAKHYDDQPVKVQPAFPIYSMWKSQQEP